VAMTRSLHLITQIAALFPTLCHLKHTVVINCRFKMAPIRDRTEGEA